MKRKREEGSRVVVVYWGGGIVMNRWWGERRLSLFLWVSMEPTPCCVDRCVDGLLASSPCPSPSPSPSPSCLPSWLATDAKAPLVCAQKLTHLSAFVLCYFWIRTRRRENALPSEENRVPVSVPVSLASVRALRTIV